MTLIIQNNRLYKANLFDTLPCMQIHAVLLAIAIFTTTKTISTLISMSLNIIPSSVCGCIFYQVLFCVYVCICIHVVAIQKIQCVIAEGGKVLFVTAFAKVISSLPVNSADGTTSPSQESLAVGLRGGCLEKTSLKCVWVWFLLNITWLVWSTGHDR